MFIIKLDSYQYHRRVDISQRPKVAFESLSLLLRI